MRKNKQLIISIFALLSIVLVTTGVSYSLLDYDNSETSSKSQLVYNYTNYQDTSKFPIHSIVPMSDEKGKKLSTDGEVFHFSVSGNIQKDDEIPYEITISKDATSTLSEDNVKVYLTEVSDGKEYPTSLTTDQTGVVRKYSELEKSSLLDENDQRIIYQGNAEYGIDGNFRRDYNLRIWVDENAKLESTRLEDGSIVYQGKTFSVKVNIIQKK